jgi:hypothetical protein
MNNTRPAFFNTSKFKNQNIMVKIQMSPTGLGFYSLAFLYSTLSSTC